MTNLEKRILYIFGTKKEFAKKLGITTVALSNKLNNLNRLKLVEIREWAKLLEVSINEFIELLICNES